MKNKILNALLSCLFLFPAAFSYAELNADYSEVYSGVSAPKCVRPTVGFFNGMLNNREAAENNFDTLKSRLSGQNAIFTKFKMPFNYVLFYNNTEGISKDINEVFRQLKKEEDGTVALDPRTEQDHRNHKSYAAIALSQGMGLLLVGHSQGNFFLNDIYNYCKQNARSVPCRAIHIGSPSSRNNGPYFLSNNDKIIQTFYAISKRSFQPNITIPFSANDATGHGFIKTYLDKTKPAEQLILEEIDTVLLDFCPFM